MGCTFSEQSWWNAVIQGDVAAITQHLSDFKGCIDKNLRRYAKQQEGFTALMYSIKYGQIKVLQTVISKEIQILISHRQILNLKISTFGQWTLDADQNGQEKARNIDPKGKNFRYLTPKDINAYTYAILLDKKDVIKAMMDVMDDKIAQFLFNDQSQLTCLEAAVMLGNEEFIETFLSLIDQDKLFEQESKKIINCLVIAVYTGNIGMIQYLCQKQRQTCLFDTFSENLDLRAYFGLQYNVILASQQYFEEALEFYRRERDKALQRIAPEDSYQSANYSQRRTSKYGSQLRLFTLSTVHTSENQEEEMISDNLYHNLDNYMRNEDDEQYMTEYSISENELTEEEEEIEFENQETSFDENLREQIAQQLCQEIFQKIFITIELQEDLYTQNNNSVIQAKGQLLHKYAEQQENNKYNNVQFTCQLNYLLENLQQQIQQNIFQLQQHIEKQQQEQQQQQQDQQKQEEQQNQIEQQEEIQEQDKIENQDNNIQIKKENNIEIGTKEESINETIKLTNQEEISNTQKELTKTEKMQETLIPVETDNIQSQQD